MTVKRVTYGTIVDKDLERLTIRHRRDTTGIDPQQRQFIFELKRE